MKSLRAAAMLGGLLAAGLVGCSPGRAQQPEPTQIAWSLPAARGGHGDGMLHTADGAALYVQALSPRTEPRASVVLAHGLREHSGHYLALARELQRRGFAVFAFDLRGHGRSSGARSDFSRIEPLVHDLDEVVGLARSTHEDAPVIVFGHGLGGLLATLLAEHDPPRQDGLVLSAPALLLPVDAMEQCAVALVADLAGQAPLLRVPMASWSRDPSETARNQADPLVFQEPGPARSLLAMLEGAAVAREQAPLVRVPLLVLHGEADLVTLPLGSKQLVAAARSEDKTLRLYPGLMHALLREPERAEVLRDLVLWLETHSNPPTAAEVTPPESFPADTDD